MSARNVVDGARKWNCAGLAAYDRQLQLSETGLIVPGGRRVTLNISSALAAAPMNRPRRSAFAGTPALTTRPTVISVRA